MTGWQKTGLILLILATLAIVKFNFFSGTKDVVQEEQAQEEQVVQPKEDENKDVPKSYVSVYFIGQNSNKEDVYKIVKREYKNQATGTKLRYSITSLLRGPTKWEKTKGIYSEIPAGTKLISLNESPDKIVINLSGNFEQGGGTDSIYKRLYQIIKTANKNTTLDVYLNIDGKQANVVGGDGIMVNQPLNDKSLDE